jgi:5-formyltetrahydrofolate cyclo-ligase
VSVSTSDRLKRDKKAVRAAVRALRDEMPEEERRRATITIARAVLDLPEIRRASTVMVFSSFGTEVGTVPIVDELVGRGVRVALPRVEGPDIVPVHVRPGDAMVEAAFGMPEPADGELLDVADVDAAVTPGLAFDRDGHRVGYGGGFYDRFFAAARADLAKIAVCFGVQVVDEVPHGPFDVPVDVIVTERGAIRCP